MVLQAPTIVFMSPGKSLEVLNTLVPPLGSVHASDHEGLSHRALLPTDALTFFSTDETALLSQCPRRGQTLAGHVTSVSLRNERVLQKVRLCYEVRCDDKQKPSEC